MIEWSGIKESAVVRCVCGGDERVVEVEDGSSGDEGRILRSFSE
jgi:hypothetical protein